MMKGEFWVLNEAAARSLSQSSHLRSRADKPASGELTKSSAITSGSMAWGPRRMIVKEGCEVTEFDQAGGRNISVWI
jgi:hypothetical protein